MHSASAIRLQIEAALAHRIPSALTPPPKAIRPVVPTGIAALDILIGGGLPVGAITEMVGPECSGRSSTALSFLAGMTQAGSVVAWIDVSDTLDPESAAAAGVDLSRLLWVRCGVTRKPDTARPIETFHLADKYWIAPPALKGLHGGGCGGHPRTEVKGLSKAVSEFLRPDVIAPRCAEPQPRAKPEREHLIPTMMQPAPKKSWLIRPTKPWARIEQALRVADLLLQASGFAAIVLDMASIAPEYISRVPLATWFRYRTAAERTQGCLLLLTQHPCAKSSSELQLRFHLGTPSSDESTVLAGMDYRVEVERHRFNQPASNLVAIRKPPQRENGTSWHSNSLWAGVR
jgi:recombination protein RecA